MERAIQVMSILLFVLFALTGCSQEERQQLVEQANQKLEQASQKIEAASEELGNARDKAADQAGDLRDTLSASVAEGASAAQEQLGVAGSIKLTTSPPIQTKACYIHFIPASSGRPAFLQVRSYRSESEETYPAVFLQGRVDASAVSELAGATVPMQMFVQRASDGPVAYASNGASVQVKVESVTEAQLSATIVAASLAQTDVATPLPVAGTIQGVFSE